MSDGSSVAIADEVEADIVVEVLVDDTLPRVPMTPPLKLVPLCRLGAAAVPVSITHALDVDAGVVAELELDAVGGHEDRLCRCRRCCRCGLVSGGGA